MPYIKPEYRDRLDGPIHSLAEAITAVARESQEETAFAGLLNYACTCIALGVVKARFGRIRYGHIAVVTGVFKNVADEFYRRIAAPYEDEQIEKSGDLPGYLDLTGVDKKS
jgi:Domain of unknown function (DUF6899)